MYIYIYRCIYIQGERSAPPVSSILLVVAKENDGLVTSLNSAH